MDQVIILLPKSMEARGIGIEPGKSPNINNMYRRFKFQVSSPRFFAAYIGCVYYSPYKPQVHLFKVKSYKRPHPYPVNLEVS